MSFCWLTPPPFERGYHRDMNMKKISIIAAAGLAAMTSVSASAGGLNLPVVEGTPAVGKTQPTSPWTGLWAGVSMGQAYSTYDFSGRLSSNASPATDYLGLDLPDFGGHGSLVGLQAGYNHQFHPRGVWGVELNADSGDVGTSTSLTYAFSGNALTLGYDFRARTFGSVLGRVGYLVNDQTLIYGLAGLSSLKGTGTAYTQVNGNRVGRDSDLTLVGATVGLGVETMLSDKVSLKVDYQMTKYNRHTYWAHKPVNDYSSLDSGLSATSQALHAAVVWHF